MINHLKRTNLVFETILVLALNDTFLAEFKLKYCEVFSLVWISNCLFLLFQVLNVFISSPARTSPDLVSASTIFQFSFNDDNLRKEMRTSKKPCLLSATPEFSTSKIYANFWFERKSNFSALLQIRNRLEFWREDRIEKVSNLKLLALKIQMNQILSLKLEGRSFANIAGTSCSCPYVLLFSVSKWPK